MKNILIIILISFLIFYIFLLVWWYKYPAEFFGLKYTIKDNEKKITDFKEGPYLFVVDHSHPAYMDIMIMSQEIHQKVEKPEDFYLVSKKCKGAYDYPIYYTGYNILEITKGTTEKCIEKLNMGKNVVVFLQEKFKGKGIYHMLKETGAKLVLVKKRLIENKYGKKLTNDLRWSGIKYSISYNEINDYPIEEKDEQNFMEWTKDKLFS